MTPADSGTSAAVFALRAGTPDHAGLSAAGLVDVRRQMEEGIADGVFPGAVALVAREGIVGWHEAYGQAQLVPQVRPMREETIFDLASLTKVIAALPVALALIEQGRLDLDVPVHVVLPEFQGDQRHRVTLRHLLAHTAGLPSWRALYLHARTRGDVLAEICRTPLVAAPGATVEYSDLSILLLGSAIERVSGRRLDALVEELLTAPLGLARTMFCPPAALWPQCAATEAGNIYEREKVGAEGAQFPWREHVLCGEVHDGNAHYAMDGVAPHAGLFSAAWDVALVAQQWLRPGPVVSADRMREAIADQRRGADGYPRGLGWVLHHAGTFFEALGPRSFGHTGFTGTSVAIDPDADLLVVLLTNRVHLGGDNIRIQDFRPRFHHAVAQALR